MMKVCIICSTFPPQSSGLECGIGHYTRGLAEALAALESSQISVLTSTSYAGSSVPSQNLRVVPLVRRWNLAALPTIDMFLRAQGFSVVSLQYQPSIYGQRWSQFNALLPIVLSRSSRRLVTTFHTITNPSRFSPTRLSAYMLTRYSRHLVVTNEHHRRQLLKLHCLPEDILSLIPVGTNIPLPGELWNGREAARDEVRQKLGIRKDVILLSHFGTFYPGKGLETLLRAMALLVQSQCPVHLLAFGQVRPKDESYFGKLVALVQDYQLEDHVILERDCSETTVSKYLIASDIYAVPYDDGVSSRRTSLAAGFAHGLPVISTMAKDMDPLFRPDENVILVSPLDSAELSRAVAQLVASDERRLALANASIQMGQRLSWTLIAQRMEGILASLS
jgi:glycosyltransferase involved in cell wall biosynthesis